MNQLKRLILASSSPRRKQLMADSGYNFEVLPADIDESFSPSLSYTEVPVYLAEKKAKALVNNCQKIVWCWLQTQ